jgi:RHS repeat-associated protein
MTSMLSLILAFMLTMGGGAAANICPGPAISPVNACNSSGLNLDANVNEKPLLGEISKIRLFEPMLIAQKARIISLFRIDFEKSLLVEHYYFRARHLDPIMGRFLQTDPMGYEDSLNLYQALNMNPVNFTDPFGLYTDFYWEAKENRNREKGPTEPNPADAMTRAALGQHAKNTAVNFGLYAVATEVPVVGPAFVAGYATRQVGEGYIDYLNQRWNVSVMESGTSRFFKKASAPVMALLDLIGITGGVRSITDDSLSDEERGKLLMNSYNQLSWTAIGGYYGWKQINGRTSGPKFNNLSESEIFQIKKALKEADMSDASVLLEGADMPPDYYGMTLGDKGFIINRSIINNYNLLLETLKHELKHILDRRDIGNPGAYGSHLEDAANAAEKIK